MEKKSIRRSEENCLLMEVNVQIDEYSGMILISLGNMRVAMVPQDVVRFASMLCAAVAVHPQLQSKNEPQILIAGVMPRLDGEIKSNGH